MSPRFCLERARFHELVLNVPVNAKARTFPGAEAGDAKGGKAGTGTAALGAQLQTPRGALPPGGHLEGALSPRPRRARCPCARPRARRGQSSAGSARPSWRRLRSACAHELPPPGDARGARRGPLRAAPSLASPTGAAPAPPRTRPSGGRISSMLPTPAKPNYSRSFPKPSYHQSPAKSGFHLTDNRQNEAKISFGDCGWAGDDRAAEDWGHGGVPVPLRGPGQGSRAAYGPRVQPQSQAPAVCSGARCQPGTAPADCAESPAPPPRV